MGHGHVVRGWSVGILLLLVQLDQVDCVDVERVVWEAIQEYCWTWSYLVGASFGAFRHSTSPYIFTGWPIRVFPGFCWHQNKGFIYMLLTVKHNFCFVVNNTSRTTRLVTLYVRFKNPIQYNLDSTCPDSRFYRLVCHFLLEHITYFATENQSLSKWHWLVRLMA